MRSCVWLLVAAAACQRESSAQVASDPLGPVRCYQVAANAGLSEDSAIQLCASALDASPGNCFAAGIARHTELSTQQVQQLCTGTTSTEPVACYERLDAIGTLTESQIIDYCATRCALGPAPAETSSTACVGVALERGNLTHQQAGQLCAGSRSVGPALCYEAGVGLHTISTDKLINLCAETRRCQYVNAAPPAGY